MNAVIYARYSSDKQNEQSIDGQLRYCREYAERMGYSVVGEYVDRAISGTSDKRPEFQRMIRDAAARTFQFIIVWKLDRFSRNRYDSAIYKARLKKYGVRVISATEGIGDNRESILLEAVLEASAEMYSSQLGENAARGMRENALKGLTTGGNIPLGYRIEDKRLVLDEQKARIVRYIYSLRADGKTKKEIVDACNARGYKTKNGNPFYSNALHAILTNRMYIGDYTYKGEIARTCPAVVDEKIFAAVQEAEKPRKTHKKTEEDGALFNLTGKIFCGHCKKPMVGDSGTSRTGKVYHYYACSGRKKRSGCKKKSENYEYIEWYVCEQTVEYVLQPQNIVRIAEGVTKEYGKEFNHAREAVIEKRLREIDREFERILDTMLDAKTKSVIDAANRRAEQLEVEKADLLEEQRGIKILAAHAPKKEDIEAWLRSYCKGDLLDPEFRRRIIDSLVNKVYLYDDKILIYYNTNDRQCSIVEEATEDIDEIVSGSDTTQQGEPNRSISEHIIFRSGCFALVKSRG